MFNNLIESSSHTREFKRRGSFFLFTTATYILLFVIAGVASIYAYDARLEDQNTEIVTMVGPVDVPAPPVAVTHNATLPRGNNSRQNIAVRQIATERVDNPRLAPDNVSSAPNTNPPIPRSGVYTIGPDNSDPVGDPNGSNRPGPDGSGRNIGSGRQPVIEIDPPPPPVKIEKAFPKVISKGPITGLALSLPKPPYPQIARQAGANGPVNVQVLIDETGRVVSAKAISGNPLLRAAAQQAAFAARFSPTTLGDQAVKVSGVITYNFVLQ
jgi:protein TonB